MALFKFAPSESPIRGCLSKNEEKHTGLTSKCHFSDTRRTHTSPTQTCGGHTLQRTERKPREPPASGSKSDRDDTQPFLSFVGCTSKPQKGGVLSKPDGPHPRQQEVSTTNTSVQQVNNSYFYVKGYSSSFGPAPGFI